MNQDFYEFKIINELIPLLNNPNYLVVVEGPKDVQSLIDLGIIDSEIYCLNKRKKLSMPDRLEEISTKNKEVVILTDFDKEGKTLFTTIFNELSRLNIKVINAPRTLLMSTKVSHIEGLYTRYSNLKDSLF